MAASDGYQDILSEGIHRVFHEISLMTSSVGFIRVPRLSCDQSFIV